MRNIENIRKKHRNNIILHVGKFIYGRYPSSEEIKEIELMLDIGRTIPEILAALRLSNKKIADPESTTESTGSVDIVDYSSFGNEYSCLRTPLERHFQEYVGS
jgi:hypothetical protein